MKRQILFILAIVSILQTIAVAEVIPVPSRSHPTIQSAINDSHDGDVIVVAPGVYSGPGNVDLDFSEGLQFGTRAITVMSENPQDPAVVAATIIDCGGTLENPHRAFDFTNGEGNDSKVLGFTIINGYQRGDKGGDGTIPVPFNVFGLGEEQFEDPYFYFWPANNGGDANSKNLGIDDGYGGAIRCFGSSPTIQYCVIKDCTVVGPVGGNGADGNDGPWELVIDPFNPPYEFDDGQWGGHGGRGIGNGYGGAISCQNMSNPIISDCTFENNIARGGIGGDGGDGGNGAYPPDYSDGWESFGGDGNDGIGDGRGGAIYCYWSDPVVTRCTFINNTATLGMGGTGGIKGIGTTIDAQYYNGDTNDGNDGEAYSAGYIAGGAVYYDYQSDPNFIDCTFINSKAYDSHGKDPFGQDIPDYTFGGAIYSTTGNHNYLSGCEFTGSLGGAVYCDGPSAVDINDCVFAGNSDIWSGGALYIGEASAPVEIKNSVFSSNSSYYDGGAIESKSDITLESCSFANNEAHGWGGLFSGYGGAINLYHWGVEMDASLTSCSFYSNEGIYGGAFSSENFHADFNDCYFISNKAESGGALDFADGNNVTITGGIIQANVATTENGGGIGSYSTEIAIRDCVFEDNLATGPVSCGGAISFYAPRTHSISNCLFADNSATENGGAIYSYFRASTMINNCTFSGNAVTGSSGIGGGIFCEQDSDPTVIDSIFADNSNIAIYEYDSASDVTISYSLFNGNTAGAFYDDGVLKTDVQIGSVNNNDSGDPLFLSGSFGDFYLNQLLSPAIDAGSDTAANLGLDSYTTDVCGVFDTDIVDMGYHYSYSDFTVPLFHVDTGVIGGHGSIAPADGNYPIGTILELTATPDMGYRVKKWTGTDDDSSFSTTNTVIVNSNKIIRIEFEQPTTLLVKVGGGEGYYADIKDAVDDAVDRDTVIVYPGIYYGLEFILDKAVTIRSLSPEDRTCVEATIIDGLRGKNQWVRDGFIFEHSEGGSALLNGLTLRNFGGRPRDGRNGGTGVNGQNGYDSYGSAIIIDWFASPTIKNCIIRKNFALASDGGNGGDAGTSQDGTNAGRGGWGGRAYGGAIFCGRYSNSKFINCEILENEARGGNGGNGGNQGAMDNGAANYGGNWSTQSDRYYRNYDSCVAEGDTPAPFQTGEIVDGDLWQYWIDVLPNSSGGYSPLDPLEGDYRWYSAYGGGVFCDSYAVVDFNNCEIRGNRTYGGISGIGGTWYSGGIMEPIKAYELPTFGGGVYCRAGSSVTFTDCNIMDNIASEPEPDDSADEVWQFRLDTYIGHGGGVCAEDSAMIKFVNCNIDNNKADAGGGVHIGNSNTRVEKTRITSNRAWQGGGLYGNHASAVVIDSNIVGNTAGVPVLADPCEYLNIGDDPCDPTRLYDPCLIEVMFSIGGGIGGGLHFWSVDANIVNCIIQSNESEKSAGGLFLGGETYPSIKNCLILENTAENDGGAISVSNFTNLTVSNCTILNNVVASNEPNYIKAGGALYCSDDSYAKITDSILWDNLAEIGPEIAVNLGPAAVEVSHCDVKGGKGQVYYQSPEMLIWDDVNNFNADPCFVHGPLGYYYLSQPTALVPTKPLSPAVDAGSDSAQALGLDSLTTRIDSQGDSGLVDLGYHYLASGSLEIYELTVQVTGGLGTLTASLSAGDYNEILDVYYYYVGTTVELTATAEEGWRVSSWSGTIDDTSREKTNTVIMNENKHVTVSFEQPVILNVPGEYTSIQQAFDAAEEGDTILLGTGVYKTTNGFNLRDKNIIIRSSNPDDPCVVANTIIEQLVAEGGNHHVAFNFVNVGPETVLDGITIRGFRIYGIDGDEVYEPENPGESGYNGTDQYGVGIRLWGSSPIIKNCIIEDCVAQGGNGGDGEAGGDPNFAGGHGGWPGRASGGGMACLFYDDKGSNPKVINCIFRNCKAIGGNGGNGGDGTTEPGAPGGKGGGWHYEEDIYWPFGRHLDGSPFDGKYDPYTKYTGLGGAVYVGAGCAPTFEECEFSNNSSYGGYCGITGINGYHGLRDEPASPRRIDTFGGAVYCDSGSNVRFIGCQFNDNIADANLADAILTDPIVSGDSVDPYTGLGGAVAYEDGAKVNFEGCKFNANRATLGGSLYGKDSDAVITECDFRNNRAYHGGGLYTTGGELEIAECNIIDNEADADPCDTHHDEILGQGGGIHCALTTAEITDCDISGNQAKASGGGVYSTADSNSAFINCLLTRNTAGRDGGAVSANLYSQLELYNCTLAHNTVTETGFEEGYGGGLSCSYDSLSKVKNSILWGNFAGNGSQIAISSGFEYEYMPSRIYVSYSDIQGGWASVFVDVNCILNWQAGNLSGTSESNPLFVSQTDPNYILGDYYLSQPATGEPNQITLGLSPCVNAGTFSVDIGMNRRTTRTDNLVDTGNMDMGYHYVLDEGPTCKNCDFDDSDRVDGLDLKVIASNWLDDGCGDSDGWCGGADLNMDHQVDFKDYAILGDCWMFEDVVPPKPDPAKWLVTPYSTVGAASIMMEAQEAYDTWTGKDVEYYFDCVSGGCHDRGWDPCSTYEDTGLVFGQQYGYRVKARDTSANQNETYPSAVGYAVTGEDTTPPVTDPDANDPYKAMWAENGEPNAEIATEPNAIKMTARTATDASGVEYYFECIFGPGHDSGWQGSPIYQDTGLTPETLYTYRVRTRDKSDNHNMGQYSDEASEWTSPLDDPPVIDIEPPVTYPAAPDPYKADFAVGGFPAEILGEDGNLHHIMTAQTATDDSPPVMYWFVCFEQSGLSSTDWQESSTYDVAVSIPGHSRDHYHWQVRVRDSSVNLNEGTPSDWWSPEGDHQPN